MYEDAGDDGAPNLYVHHDIILPAFPLSVAWLDCNPASSSQIANLAAVSVCRFAPYAPAHACMRS